MKKYKYKLDNLLNIKEKLEKKEEMELKRLNEIVNMKKIELEYIKVQKQKTIIKQKNNVSKSINILETRTSNTYLSRLKVDIEKKEEEVNKAIDIAKKQKEKLIEFSKERKILEKLKEKNYELYLDESKKNEQKEIDEIVSSKYKFRGDSNG